MNESAFRRESNPPAPVRLGRNADVPNSGEALLEATQEIEREQQTILEAAPIEQTYQEALATYIQAKFTQVEHIEECLENLIERQQARLQQSQTGKPGFLARPGTRQAWQSQRVHQQARLLVLHTRLEAVREIKEGMGIHAPRIEELATRKMRAAHPEMASDWDALYEAARRHKALLRKQEQEQKRVRERRGWSQSLGLSRYDG